MKEDDEKSAPSTSRLTAVLERVPRPLRRPARIIVGVLLLIGGVLGFLPIVGFWMIPLGLSILAVDIPVAGRALDWLSMQGRRLVQRIRGDRRHSP